MTAELAALALAILLQAVHWVWLAVEANRELGTEVTLGPRDTVPDYSARLGRLHRAFHNHYEALILFTAAVMVTTLSDGTSAVTAACAWTYLAARLLYVPAYLAGLNPWRSVAWLVGFLATVLMTLAAFA